MTKEYKIKKYSNKKILDILKNASLIPETNDKVLNIIFGPYGSGKSTLLANLYKENLLTYPYLDILSNLDNEKNKKLIEEKIKEGKSFVFEWNSSNKEILNLINKAKENGYTVKVFFVFTGSYQINENRTKNFNQNFNEDIKSNYYNSLSLCKSLKLNSDEFILINTSLKDKEVVFQSL